MYVGLLVDGREVAVKRVLKKHNKRLEKEVENLAKLKHHDNIVSYKVTFVLLLAAFKGHGPGISIFFCVLVDSILRTRPRYLHLLLCCCWQHSNDMVQVSPSSFVFLLAAF